MYRNNELFVFTSAEEGERHMEARVERGGGKSSCFIFKLVFCRFGIGQ